MSADAKVAVASMAPMGARATFAGQEAEKPPAPAGESRPPPSRYLTDSNWDDPSMDTHGDNPGVSSVTRRTAAMTGQLCRVVCVGSETKEADPGAGLIRTRRFQPSSIVHPSRQ
jgi:hypothetical protein